MCAFVSTVVKGTSPLLRHFYMCYLNQAHRHTQYKLPLISKSSNTHPRTNKQAAYDNIITKTTTKQKSKTLSTNTRIIKTPRQGHQLTALMGEPTRLYTQKRQEHWRVCESAVQPTTDGAPASVYAYIQ